MTFKERCLIEPGDIMAVYYECSNCHSGVTIPIEKIPSAEYLSKMSSGSCSYCQTPWGFQQNGQETETFAEFNTLLKQIAQAMAGRNMKLQLEIKCPD